LGNKKKPTFFNNITFFVNYQLGNKYIRYFMWNFAGRQNDTQYDGSNVHGNWISGIRFLDAIRLGNQDLLPDKYQNSKSRNKYYLLPLILGLLGLLFQVSKDLKNFSVILMLFFFTGIAIVIYLNQTPLQPRERDYAYAGSFYAFAIWIGLGVASVYDSVKRYRKGPVVASVTVLISLLAVPAVMAKENWNDHDRSGRYTARDIARNYLGSCAENAIIYTNGDNDTFPLWYVQEVEGYRTDVRVVNLMLFNMEWNIKQMRMKNYESEPLPFTLPEKLYAEGVNSSFYVLKDKRILRMKTLVEGIKTGNSQFFKKTIRGDDITVIPSNNLVLPVDTMIVLANGTVREADLPQVETPMVWTMPQGQYLKGNLAQLDILASFNWERPIYFVTGGNQGALSLEDFFQLEGLAFRLVPISTPGRDFFNYGRIDTSILYNNLMNKFTWGRMNKPGVYIDYYTERTFSVIRFRKDFVRLAEAYIHGGNTTKAKEVLDRCMELAPDSVLPFDYYVSGISYPGKEGKIIHQTGLIEAYYQCGAIEKANTILLRYADILKQDLVYYDALSQRFKNRFADEFYRSQGVYEELVRLAKAYDQKALADQL
ncbi:MAG TPA: tetratricopeptide repeat protein, partial [Bacteroidales bacterium]|nr:tetratricopeptide repeat protein [Bacteroidales bacterium]